MSTTTPHPRVRRAAAPRRRVQRVPAPLGRYREARSGAIREIVCLPGAGGSTLVIDRDAVTLGERLLVAHLAADEPPANARIVASLYLADENRGRCRHVTAEDVTATPSTGALPDADEQTSPDTPLLDRDGVVYRIQELCPHGSLTELRWTRSDGLSQGSSCEPLTLREVVAQLEDYEPARSITASALAAHDHDRRVSTRRLRVELERSMTSAIVLNRGVREVMQRKLAGGELSMSQIAMRCGRAKLDRRGVISGQTSWLARRVGLLPHGGCAEPSPWVHSDVLALIARDGLRASPREVEL